MAAPGGRRSAAWPPFPDGLALKLAVDSYLIFADPTGADCRHDGAPIGDWDVSRVTDMRGLFAAYMEFNADISKWNTAAVTNMGSMFSGAGAFNQDISSWNTAAVTSMSWIFHDAGAFNQNISTWDVMAVTRKEGMWTGATAMTGEAHKPCTAIGFGADGKNPWRKC